MIVNAKQSASKSKVIASWSESRHRAKTQLKQSKPELLIEREVGMLSRP
jgi:hypothetical protein